MATEECQPHISAALEQLGLLLTEALTISHASSAYTSGVEVNLAEAILRGLQDLASALRALGIANATTPMGAVEVLAMEVKAGSERLASAIEGLAESVRER